MSTSASKTKTYSNGEVTIVWKPSLCIHSERCFRGLPEVFDPKSRPWIMPEGTSGEAIIEQVAQCPSGALSAYYNGEEPADTSSESQAPLEIEVAPGGPLIVKGGITVKHSDGQAHSHAGTTALCRCGASSNKPYCDGSHRKVNFDG